MMMAAVLLQDDNTEVPANLFSLFDNDARKGAMMAILQIYAQAAAEWYEYIKINLQIL